MSFPSSRLSLAKGYRTLVLLVVTCFCLHVAAQQASRPGALVQAQSALDSNQPQQAIEILSMYLRTHAGNDSAHLLLAEAFAMSGRTEEAEAQYQESIKRSASNYVALAGLGELYANTGRVEKAEPLLARAVRNSRHQPQLQIEWAEVLTRLHRFSDAANVLRGVAAPREPDQRVAYFRLNAAVAAGLGNSSAAAAHMESALAVRTTDPNLQLATAMAQRSAGNLPRLLILAQAAFSATQNAEAGLLLLEGQLKTHAEFHQTVLALRSLALSREGELQVRQRVAEMLIANGDFTEATIDLRRAAELEPTNADSAFNLALAEFKAGKTKEALAVAEQARLLKANAEIEGLLGDIQEALGDDLAAVKHYQAAAALAPADEDRQIALALELIRHRNFEPAKLVLEQAQKSLPRSWRVAVALGMVQYFIGTKQEATEILIRAVELAPDPELIFRYLGDVELDETAAPDPSAVTRICGFANDHPDAAREQFYCGALMLHIDYASREKSRTDEIIRRLTLAAQGLPNEAPPHCELGRAYEWLEEWQPAEKEFETCAHLNPDSAQAHYRLSQIYHHTGQAERAREEIQLFKAASERRAEENEQHENSLKTFIYTIRNDTATHRP